MKQCIKCGAVQDDSHLRCNYPNCGGELKEFTTKEQAMEWWNKLTLEERYYKLIPWLKSKGLNITSRNPGSLTGSQIEEIWKQETQSIKQNKVEPKVDFELLDWTIAFMKDNPLDVDNKTNDNLQLFFKLLAEKPTFAQVAHKELNKLNR